MLLFTEQLLSTYFKTQMAQYTFSPIEARGRKLIVSKPNRKFSAPYFAIYSPPGLCPGEHDYASGQGNISSSAKDNCSSNALFPVLDASLRSNHAFPGLPQFSLDPNTTHRGETWIRDNLAGLLGMIGGSAILPGFSTRGESYIVPFAGSTTTEVQVTGSVYDVTDICDGITVGHKFAMSATQFGFNNECQLFQRETFSLSGTTGVSAYGASFADGIAALVADIQNPLIESYNNTLANDYGDLLVNVPTVEGIYAALVGGSKTYGSA